MFSVKLNKLKILNFNIETSVLECAFFINYFMNKLYIHTYIYINK